MASSQTPLLLRLPRRDALAITGVMLLYGLYFLVNTRSSEFLYALEIGSHLDNFEGMGSFSIDDYFAPWRYRLAPRLPQWGPYRGANLFGYVSFRLVAMATACLFMAFALAGFSVLLRALGLSSPWALGGWLLADSSFPMIFGFRGLSYLTLDDALAFALVVGAFLVVFARGAIPSTSY